MGETWLLVRDTDHRRDITPFIPNLLGPFVLKPSVHAVNIRMLHLFCFGII